jgi:hypothetical protein
MTAEDTPRDWDPSVDPMLSVIFDHDGVPQAWRNPIRLWAKQQFRRVTVWDDAELEALRVAVGFVWEGVKVAGGNWRERPSDLGDGP